MNQRLNQLKNHMAKKQQQMISKAVDTTDAPEGTTVTVDNPGQLTKGDVPGTVNVTVTYPDGTKDHVTVPVTTGDKPVADNVTNEPTVKPIEKPYGEETTTDDIKGSSRYNRCSGKVQQ